MNDYCGYCGKTNTILVGGVCDKCNPLWEKDNPGAAAEFDFIRGLYSDKKNDDRERGK